MESNQEWMKQLTEHDKGMATMINEERTRIGHLNNMVDSYCLQQDLPTGYNV